jgi:protocatechuate 3,4-dioxygenase beta subunit
MIRTAPLVLALLLSLPAALSCQTREPRAHLAQARQALESGKADISALLSDPSYMPLHGHGSFRQLIRDHAKSSRVRIVTPDEPGQRMTVAGRVLRADGKPAGETLVYVYQTNNEGVYEGGSENARLFGYLTTDPQGRFEVETIRPAGYPQSDTAQHIHLEVILGDGRRTTEILFEDDPRITPEIRRWAEGAGFPIVPVTRGKGGVELCSAEIRLR